MLNNSIDTCVICLDGDMENEANALPIDNIHELEKICMCKYSVHKNCIQEWVQKKPVCVMCNNPLYYIENNEHVSLPEGITNETNDDQDNNIEPVTSGFYRCIVTSCLIMVVLIVIYCTV